MDTNTRLPIAGGENSFGQPGLNAGVRLFIFGPQFETGRAMLSKPILLAALALAFASPALAQNAATRIYGAIEKVEGRAVTVKNKDGQVLSFELAPRGRIVSNEPLDVKTIKTGDVIAIDEVMGKPIQAHTQAFAHGANAPAQRKLETNPDATRYLGVVTAAMPTAEGVKVTVELQKNGGEMQAELTNNIVHYRNETESAAELKPGLTVMANATRGADGKLVSGFTTIEKSGRKPVDIGD